LRTVVDAGIREGLPDREGAGEGENDWTNGHFLDSRVTVTALARSRRCPWLHRRKTGTEPDTRARIGAVRLPGGTSDARGDGLHEAGRQAHQGGYGRRQVDTPGHPRVAGVAHLVRLHLL